MNIELRNFFVRCRCGYGMRFDFLEQTKTCLCGAMVMLQPGTKSYLLAQHEARRKRLAEGRTTIYQRFAKVVCRDSEGSMTIQESDMSDPPTSGVLVSMGARRFAVTVDGATFRAGNVSREFVDELQKFINEHSRTFWEL